MGDRHYVIQCRVCETTYEDDGLLLDCPRSHEPGLLGALYQTKTFEPDVAADGIYRYHRWLPIVRQLHGSGRTVTYQSDRLNRVVGLPNPGSASTATGRRRAPSSRPRRSRISRRGPCCRACQATTAASW